MSAGIALGRFWSVAPTLTNLQASPPLLDSSSRLRVVVDSISGGGLVVSGATTPADSFANPSNAVATFALGACLDSTVWVRTRCGGSADGIAAPGGGIVAVNPFNLAFNSTLGSWQRTRAKAWGTTPGANVGGETAGAQVVLAQLAGPDGAGGYAAARVDTSGAQLVTGPGGAYTLGAQNQALGAVLGLPTYGPALGYVVDTSAGWTLARYSPFAMNTRGGMWTSYRKPPTQSGVDNWSNARAFNAAAANLIGVACVVFSAVFTNNTAAPILVALVNSSGTPVNGSPILFGPVLVGAYETISFSDRHFGPAGLYFTLGASVAVVTTCASTVTLAAAPASCTFEVRGST